MKGFLVGFLVCLFLFLVLFLYLHGVGKRPRHNASGPDRVYVEWEAKTREIAVAASPEQLREWVQRVQDAFTPFEAARAGEKFPEAYAEEFYFRDAFHLYTDLEAMTAYMVATAEASPGVTFTFSPPLQSGIDVMLPWTMILPGGNGVQKSLGVSHLRFNAAGRVIFHQDYWDSADVLVPKVPVANGLIELVRRQF